MQRLTFDGINDLYLTPYGAHTLEDYQRMLEVRKTVVKQPYEHDFPHIEVSAELELRNERCIDRYGCGLFGG
jgi:hypothetical protein